MCSNEYLKDFIEEVEKLELNGLKVGKRVYEFRLKCLVMDAPATAFVLGVKNHGAFNCCRRCKCVGHQADIEGGVTRTGRQKSRMCYTDLDAVERVHEDFVNFACLNDDEHDRGVLSGRKGSRVRRYPEQNDENLCEDEEEEGEEEGAEEERDEEEEEDLPRS